jgi:hypothetical protein
VRQGAVGLLVFAFVAERACSSFSRYRSDFPLKLDFCRRLALVFRSPVDRTPFPDILDPHLFSISLPRARSADLAATHFHAVLVPCRCVFGPCTGQILVWVSCGQISSFAPLMFCLLVISSWIRAPGCSASCSSARCFPDHAPVISLWFQGCCFGSFSRAWSCCP